MDETMKLLVEFARARREYHRVYAAQARAGALFDGAGKMTGEAAFRAGLYGDAQDRLNALAEKLLVCADAGAACAAEDEAEHAAALRAAQSPAVAA